MKEIVTFTLDTTLPMQQAVQDSISDYFARHMTFPDVIIMNALDRIAMPSHMWHTFHFDTSYPIDILHIQDEAIQMLFAVQSSANVEVTALCPVGTIICVGDNMATDTMPTVIIQNDPPQTTPQPVKKPSRKRASIAKRASYAVGVAVQAMAALPFMQFTFPTISHLFKHIHFFA